MNKIFLIIFLLSNLSLVEAKNFIWSNFDNIDSVYIKTLPDTKCYYIATTINGNEKVVFQENATIDNELIDSQLTIRPLSREEFEEVWLCSRRNEKITSPQNIQKLVSLINRLEYDAPVLYNTTQSVMFAEYCTDTPSRLRWSVGEYGNNIAQIILFNNDKFEIIWISSFVYINNSRYVLSPELRSYIDTLRK